MESLLINKKIDFLYCDKIFLFINMTLIELRYLLAVAATRHFGRAAEKCFVTQPALSLGIKSLEAELGVSLFERSKTGVHLTPVGSQIAAQAQRVMSEAATLKELATRFDDPLSGSLRLGLIHTIGPYLLPDLVPALKKLAPKLTLHIEENTTDNLRTQLKNGAIEVAILALPFAAPGLVKTTLYDEVFEVVVPKTHALAKLNNIRRGDLQDENVLLLGEGHCFANQVEEACPGVREQGETLSGNSLETVRNMVASGFGITVLPARANTSRYRNSLLKAIPFAKPQPLRRVAMAWRVGYTRTAVLDVLQQAVALT
jgi:LysR family hydrogen peroxide-inducible transcriptional activator